MGSVTLNPVPVARPTSSRQARAPSPTTIAGAVSKLQMRKREEETTRITITQTLPRPSSTHVATATLHGGLPAEPAPQSSEGISDKQLGAILGATLGTIVVILLIGCCFLRRRRQTRPSQSPPTLKSHTPSPVAPSTPRFVPGCSHPRPLFSFFFWERQLTPISSSHSSVSVSFERRSPSRTYWAPSGASTSP